MNWGEKSGVVIYRVSRYCTLDCTYKKNIKSFLYMDNEERMKYVHEKS